MIRSPLPVLTVDLIEDRFRFTASVTHGAASLDRLARADLSRPDRPTRRDPFAQVIMERAPHLAEQPGSILRGRLTLRRRGVYREPIRVAVR